MARKKRVMQATPEKRMVLGFGYGLLMQKSREEAQAGRQADRA